MNGDFLDNPGLYTGEMSLILFFTRYARYTRNHLYSDYAYDLMGKIQKKLHKDTPINYKQGLAGIGSAIEYLAQNVFFEAKTDEILEDFDKQVFFSYNLPTLSINKIMDIGHYAIWRISGNSSQKNKIRNTILPQIINNLEACVMKHDLTKSHVSFFKEIVASESYPVLPTWHQTCQKMVPYDFWKKTNTHCLEQFSKNLFSSEETLSMGLHNGLAGWGLSLLTELDGDNSWISLLPDDFYTINHESIPV